ncbi:MAG: hypothetical protein UR34_C0016G0017 [candidate division WS6 bacterium GW2011_GWC1_33_20]|uniref:General stress protein n=1 Tax=candidate division WS6 bacterium GW2011_GWC1_33_20 TaxID=1619089 RepID=A0A0F9ZH32_9BACT|nr:MAG: hypothetical protein UR32_C0002G0036 [candidate division WS6 bacterium GW2011_GWE2_33_157]KKP43468.1 MAG: hypothetical protein UR34_C0016G0017 [candidate division WS6 bacterium GW2011_GWC1_33_20]OGC36132.1 MAG: hypothetical protein A2369_00400 [candidate division WS6 bacterium RIFOXYB1_FULL_33_15]OGC37586.1 MAG: hypothetical protein A2436_00050 [candidate division WS6 bacterium RIFOXYC1_FULL_33_9]HBB64905.1 hypothetical protein [Patescibacteria group bacterium]
MSSSDDFFKGLVFGAVIGAAAGLMLAPKSGVETREDIKKLSMELTDKGELLYKNARKDVEKKIREIKAAGKRLDFDSYKELVAKVIDELKNDSEVASTTAKKIGIKLNEDWEDIKSAVV